VISTLQKQIGAGTRIFNKKGEKMFQDILKQYGSAISAMVILCLMLLIPALSYV